MKKLLIFCMALMLAILPMGAATAERITIDGTVVNTQPQPVVCAAHGTVAQVLVAVGDRVSRGDILAVMETNKVYAPADGSVYLFGEAGESIAEIAAQYGAVAYLAPAKPYTITANAADRNGNPVSVIPGETVYLRCSKDGKHTGVGLLAKIDKEKYTVIVTEGEFASGETVSIYRDPAYADRSRIGRAKVTIADQIACQGEGYLVKFHVQNGATVEKGTLLYETISGSFPPGSAPHDKIVSPVHGIVAALYRQAGASLGGDSPAIATVYPDASLRIVAYAPESTLGEMHVNDPVYVSCPYIENMAEPVLGTIEKISRIPSPENSGVEAQYAVYVTVSDASSFYYGMHVAVTTQGAD